MKKLTNYAVSLFVIVIVLLLIIPPVSYTHLSLIDFHMGLSMASVYDPASGAQVALTGSVLNIYYMLLFFVADGHLALMKILVTSADVVPYGQIAFGPDVWNAMLVIFTECTVLAVKLAFPLIAIAVSYTHLEVYKRQVHGYDHAPAGHNCTAL